uniref:Uncharacterized protein n=1 Tax=Rhizophagus irregularis (strain DAOM 181602 / DAOM 197198 / MUCL 43194) TaxID=747089 RepID=U9T4X6_RHIID
MVSIQSQNNYIWISENKKIDDFINLLPYNALCRVVTQNDIRKNHEIRNVIFVIVDDFDDF